jgi:hypothetical protein
MNRFLVVTVALLSAAIASCAPRSALFVSWTIDGDASPEACDAFKSPKIKIVLAQRDNADDEPANEEFDASCKDGQASVQSAPYTSVTVELLSGKDVFGRSIPNDAAPAEGGEYTGFDADHPVEANIRVTEGRLHARLTVNGEDCGDAGVNTFHVVLRENTDPLNDVDVDEGDVSCEDGEAIYSFGPVHAGAVYKIVATADGFATDATGEGVVAHGGVTDFVVNLSSTD